MTTAYQLVTKFNHDREPERLALKNAAMAGGPFPFLRGTCHLFYRRLIENKLATGGPPAWISGDLHLENFGTYLGDNGLTYFDINDFDEAILAPLTWDILRLVTSLYVAAPGLKIGGGDAEELAAELTVTWRTELAAGKPRWIERKTAEGIIGTLMADLKTRRQDKFLDKRTALKKGSRRIVTGTGRALEISAKDRAALAAFATTLASDKSEAEYFTPLDSARRIAGTGSLGIPRFVLLVEGEGSPGDNVLLDLKEARASSIIPYSPLAQPEWQSEAHRVAALTNRCQAVSPHLLRPVEFAGRPYVLRELQPTSDRLNLALAAGNLAEFRTAVLDMGKLAAWASLRSAGRQGSATADDLIAFAGDSAVTAAIHKGAQAMATITLSDWQEYEAGYKSAQPVAETIAEKPVKKHKKAA
jgi:uncharacterized protein (DUF2252 family)